MSDLIGKSLGRYHILEQLGEGGMATVYKAYDTRLETDVAVKVIRTENLTLGTMERTLKRFEREAKSLARLTHPNIVKVTDYGEFEGKPYLVMPYLPGGTLKEHIKQGQIPWQEAVRLILPIAQALEYAHENNIIHRDVKPSNILLTEKGQPMLTDFGVAKLFDMEATADLTGTGMGVGTPEYMAPEQWQGQVGEQTDVYALGVVLYEMVTGRRPYTADTPAALLLKQANDPLPRPKRFTPGLPDTVERVILKALAREIGNRYQTMTLLTKALQKVYGEESPVEARSPNHVDGKKISLWEWLPEPTARGHGKSPGGKKKYARFIWLAGIVLIALILTLAGLLKGNPAIPLSTQTVIASVTVPTAASETSTPNAMGATRASSTPNLMKILTPTQTPLSGIGSTWTRPTDGMVMMQVSAGLFIMGSDEGPDGSRPAHSIYLDAFWMDRTEVTNDMYARCVQAKACQPPQNPSSYTHFGYYGDPQFSNYPVVNVTWEQAHSYCAWTGSRLPTEAEWEKAARGADGRTFPWGNSSPDCSLGNFMVDDKTCVGDTAKVGSYPDGASPYGVLDMAGNAAEWVADWYDAGYYSFSPSRNPLGPDSGQYKVLRGGAYQWGWYQVGDQWDWSSNGVGAISYKRDGSDPTKTTYNISNDQTTYYLYFGFRCARSAP